MILESILLLGVAANHMAHSEALEDEAVLASFDDGAELATFAEEEDEAAPVRVGKPKTSGKTVRVGKRAGAPSTSSVLRSELAAKAKAALEKKKGG